MIPNHDPMRYAVTKSIEECLSAFPAINHGPIDKQAYNNALRDLAAVIRATPAPEPQPEVTAEPNLRTALDRQCDNMAFVINHVGLPDAWLKKFMCELDEDRAALATPAPEPQPEVTAEPVAWRIRYEGDRDWMGLVFDDPRFDVALAAVPGLVAEPLYAHSPPVVEEAVKAGAWQDIATAPPTDHMNQILLAWKYRPASTGWWDIDHDFADRPEGWVSPEEGWRSYGDQCIPVEDGWPTHWQSLPAPPARSATP